MRRPIAGTALFVHFAVLAPGVGFAQVPAEEVRPQPDAESIWMAVLEYERDRLGPDARLYVGRQVLPALSERYGVPLATDTTALSPRMIRLIQTGGMLVSPAPADVNQRRISVRLRHPQRSDDGRFVVLTERSFPTGRRGMRATLTGLYRVSCQLDSCVVLESDLMRTARYRAASPDTASNQAVEPVTGATGVVEGRVVDGETGGALRGVMQIYVRGRRIGTITADDGTFLLPRVPIGQQTLVFEGPCYHSVMVQAIVQPEDDASLVLDLALPFDARGGPRREQCRR